MPVLLVATVLAVSGKQAIYAQLSDWKLIPQSERLTELYFTDHQSVSRTYQAGGQQTIRFSVRNLEHRTTTYTYAITQDSEDPKTIANHATGNVSLAQGKTARLALAIHTADQGPQSRIAVTISYAGIDLGKDTPTPHTQTIYYWMTQQEAAQ